ncbi:hypothetical protein AOZ06_39690 [Kibdelosporangium phytohabitans]|uniref:ParB-like N-terminal domain-containing protein n=2 Tax=Kibdelosporangium phytohabitans TaxID=860235 RepID=A0A0N9I5Q6_9PSEU|nr:ParB/RepB/Spo0J family partition protein [Kibdelosporangium phytohabitans]ALG15422.1 hypothetical protein AOZ06_39690 [Kibdelosporangium phytohabitans]
MPLVTLPIDSLNPADSPRLSGIDSTRAHAMAESGTDLPPIVVHRQTMRVIDGAHRLRAAQLRGADRIQARLFDGTADAAFVLAVEANVVHGLPLSPEDREAAVVRIVFSHPQWSDRVVAARTGLSDKTIAAIRRRRSADLPKLNSRVGRDGRIRPLSSAQGRRSAGELMTANPHASLREVAKAAGISLGTAVDVRRRILRGEDPVPPKQRATPGIAGDAIPVSSTVDEMAGRDHAATLQALRSDPSLRLTEAGRTLLRCLNLHMVDQDQWSRMVDGVPSHCAEGVADLAAACAAAWQQFADQVRRRGNAPV